MSANETLPPDLDRRMAGLGDVLASASDAIEFAYVFGSSASGRRSARSDVDVAIHIDEHADAHDVRLDTLRAVAKHLGTDAVDVVLLNGAPLSVAGRVLAGRRVVLDRTPFQRHRYESRVARLFQDFRLREHRILAGRYARG